MEITLDYTRKILDRERSRRESDRLSDTQIRILGDAMLPTLRQLLLEMPDEGIDRSACILLSRIETTSAIDLMIEVMQGGRPEARRSCFLSLSSLSAMVKGLGEMRNWLQPPLTATQRRLESILQHLKSHSGLKSAVFEFRHSNIDAECTSFSEISASLGWKDALPFMQAMAALVDTNGAKRIRDDCRSLEQSA